MEIEPERLKEVFAKALEFKSADERENYLAAACESDPELRQEVDSLLQAHRQSGDFFSQTLGLRPTDLDSARLGMMIGRYKLLEKIGEGGFGVVYMAEQQEPVRRKVALKIIKAGMDTKEVVARFEAERQALALMDHPNIARVIDGGATETGRPYFVMELVRGFPITEYCDQNHLSTPERLKLFIKVCQAVQHAHQKGIIHRDIKPSNVLVGHDDGEPLPKIIDFGVAKALGQKLTEKTLFTGFARLIGTPAYMSPEQAELSRVDVDTRSDIYSLGVLLYELLTGVTPFDKETLARAAYEEIRHTIQETEPLKPSTRLRALGEKLNEVARYRVCEPKGLGKLVRGDLDWIVMKCLEKDRNRRYETSNGLAKDVQRHLDHEPISASPPDRLYRAKKFVTRHKTGLATASVLVVLIAVGVVATTLEAIRARRAERTQSLLRARAENAEHVIEEKLWASYLSQARAYRWSGQSGRRFNALDVLAKAAAIRPSLELRNEAIASMSLADIRVSKEWECPADITIVAFDESNDRYARCTTNGEISVRLVRNDQEVARFPGPGKPAWFLHFSPDGRLLAARYDTGDVQVWDLSRAQAVIRAPFGPLAFSRDSRQLAVAANSSLELFELESGNRTRFELDPAVDDLAFDPDGHRLAVACDRRELAVRVFNVLTGKALLILPHPAGVKSVAWNGTGGLLASACNDHRVYVWDLTAPTKPSAILQGHRSEVTAVAFAHAEDLLASIGWDQTVRLWNALTGKLLVTDSGGPTMGFPQVQFSSDDRFLSFGTKGHAIELWEAAAGRECRSLRSESSVSQPTWSLDFNADGHLLASGHKEGVRLWDTLSGRLVAFLPIGYTRTVVFDPAGTSLLTCRQEAGVHRWPIAWSGTDRKLALRLGPPQTINLPSGVQPAMISLAGDGKTLAIADHAKGQIIVWDLEAGAVKAICSGHPNITEVTISRDGEWIASSTWGELPKKFRVVNSRSGDLALQMDSSATDCHIAFSPDCRWIAADLGENCQIWEVGTWKTAKKIPKDSPEAVMTFSRDGRIFAFNRSAQEVKFFEIAKGWNEIASLESSNPLLGSPACFSPDGARFALASDNEVIKLWDFRLLRRQLGTLGLDWDFPSFTDSVPVALPIQASVQLQAAEGHPGSAGPTSADRH